MSFIRNLKIRTKLIFGFALLLTVMVFNTALASFVMRRINREYEYMFTYPFERYSIIQELGTYFMDSRRAINRAAMYIHDAYDPLAEIANQEALVFYLRENIDKRIARYRENLFADPLMYDERREWLRGLMCGYEAAVHHYFDHYIAGVFDAAHDFRVGDTIIYVREGIYTVNIALGYHAELYGNVREFMQTQSDALTEEARSAERILIMLAAVGIILSAVAALIISSSITLPIQKAVRALNGITDGNLDISITTRDAANDEAGLLILDVLRLSESIKAVNSEVMDMIAAAADRGDLRHVIDAEKYKGEWHEIMMGLNRIAEAVDAPIIEIRDVMSDLARGNFERKVTGDYKGDFLRIKTAVNETIDALKGLVEAEMKRERVMLKIERELEKKKFEQDLDARTKLMFEATPLIIEFWDTEGLAIDCNQTTIDFYGYSDKDEYRARHLDTYKKSEPGGFSEWGSQLEKIFEKGSGHFEFTDYKPDGTVAFLEVDGIKMKIKDKDMVVTYSNDVTQIKKLREEQHRIAIAEEASRAKSDFLARMSHEIRTPLSAVMGISEIQLQNPELPPLVEESFAKIHNSASILLDLVNDILDLSKIEGDKMKLLPQRYDTAEMIANVAHIHLAYTASKDVKFKLDVDENLPARLVGDVLRVEQIVYNVLSNAFKYTHTGTVELSFSCRKASDENITLIVTITDTGFGMTPEQLKNLSMDYTRFHERRLISGTGLGMPIVYSLVKLMNAAIDIESDIGKGTKVTVQIPQKSRDNEVLGKKTAQRLQEFKEKPRVTTKRFDFEPEYMPYGKVLVVDDVDANLYVARGLLGFYGLGVETCESGYDAIEKVYSGNSYDIIFMDYMMPGMDGTETMRKLRLLGYENPIVVFTANAMIGKEEEFIKEGFDGFISKPIQTKHLDSVLKKFVRDKQPPEVINAARSVAKRKAAAAPSAKNIHNFQSDSDLIEKLRADFKQKHANSFGKIERAINSRDTEAAHILSHTIKGLAGLIKEHALSRAAEAVEHALKDKKFPTESQMRALESEMRRVLSEIKAPMPEAVSEARAFDPEKVKTLFDRLDELLYSRNSECRDFIGELRTIPEAAVLARQISDFDFAQAAKTLKVLRKVLGVSR